MRERHACVIAQKSGPTRSDFFFGTVIAVSLGGAFYHYHKGAADVT